MLNFLKKYIQALRQAEALVEIKIMLYFSEFNKDMRSSNSRFVWLEWLWSQWKIVIKFDTFCRSLLQIEKCALELLWIWKSVVWCRYEKLYLISLEHPVIYFRIHIVFSAQNYRPLSMVMKWICNIEKWIIHLS